MRVWDDEAVVYNTLSGQTHVLNALAAEALLLILDRARSEAEISAELLLAAGTDSSPAWSDALRAMLEELDRLGLIAPVDG